MVWTQIDVLRGLLLASGWKKGSQLMSGLQECCGSVKIHKILHNPCCVTESISIVLVQASVVSDIFISWYHP